MNHHNHRESRIEYQESSIENPTLAHFRHFSSLFTNLRAYKALYLRAYKAPLHLSRVLYKSTLFMQNKPDLVRRRRIANASKCLYKNGL